ncbi:MAG: hypothetical protein D3916_06600 [Candidatus Electrothrix sp. MAN1_4]|nr:hypothetical protein [Candidatus Electrothrix sp. MAN1_4]
MKNLGKHLFISFQQSNPKTFRFLYFLYEAELQGVLYISKAWAAVKPGYALNPYPAWDKNKKISFEGFGKKFIFIQTLLPIPMPLNRFYSLLFWERKKTNCLYLAKFLNEYFSSFFLTVTELGEGCFDRINHMIIIGKLERNIITAMITIWRH